MSTATLPSSSFPRWALFVGAGVLVLAAGGLVASRRAAPTTDDAPVERTTPWLENGVIHYPPSFGTRERIEFAPAGETMLTPDINVTGEVTWDARRVVAIGARIEGRLRTLAKVEGEDVQAGEVVAELESVELGRAQAEVLKARAREQVARIDAERERRLADAKVSAERDAQFAQANLEALTAERVAVEKAVEALGGTTGGELGVLKLRSPLTGRVVEAKARRGQTVSPTDTMMVVADLSKVWVELTVFERDLPAVHEGDTVDLHLPADRSTVLQGTVAHVAEVIDPEQRAAHVRVELDNAQRRLRPGLSVTATIHATGPRTTRLTVPRTAITRVDGKPTVFVKAGEHAVQPRQLKLGAEDAEDVAVLEGLQTGEQVVTHGVLALKAEVFR
ncbi:MAG: efflux RND transporter periplasmic adaptor subunit [Myxococcota bacterium]